MPESNEVSPIHPSNRMTQVITFGAQTGKKAIQTIGKLGALAVTTGISQFAQVASGHPAPTTESSGTNATTFDQNPTNQFYIYGGLGVIGALMVTIVFICPLIRRLCCYTDDKPGSTSRVSLREFNDFVREHGKRPERRRQDVEIQAPDVVSLNESVEPVNSAVTLVTNDGDIPVSFTVGEDENVIYEELIDPPREFVSPNNDAARPLSPIVEADETNDDDLGLLLAETRKKREDLKILERATKVVNYMLAHPEKREVLSVRYKDLLESAANY